MQVQWDILKWRKTFAVVSALLVVLSVVSLAVRQLNLGLDFTGGTAVEVEYAQPVDIQALREFMGDQGYESATVKFFGSERSVLVQIPPVREQSDAADTTSDGGAAKGDLDNVGARVFETLKQFDGQTEVTLSRVDEVGPQLGDELRDKGGIAMLVAMGFMLVYVSFRFQFKFALGAVAALFHDVLITLGLFSLLQMSFDQSVMAALLAVIGYSLNDTIVVSDRIRENFSKMRKASPYQIVNGSVQQTLGRTVVTSLTTLLVLVALAVFGGESVFGFAIALLFGVLVGTYSSIFVASNVLLALDISKEDFIEQKKGEYVDDLP